MLKWGGASAYLHDTEAHVLDTVVRLLNPA